jgi:hypothetical protein
MSISQMAIVWEHANVKDTDLLLLLSLADHAGDNGQCWPSVDRLASRIRKNRRSVLRSLSHLQELGYITILESGRGKSSSRYKINIQTILQDSVALEYDTGVTFELGLNTTNETTKCDKSDKKGDTTAEKVTNEAFKRDTGVTQTIKNHHRSKKESLKNRQELFDKFWQSYPRKENKGQAITAWSKVDLSLFDAIMNSLEKHKVWIQWTKENGQFIPHAATWLNAIGWENETPNIPPTYKQAEQQAQESRWDRMMRIDAERKAQEDALRAERDRRRAQENGN